ncbi:MAG: AsmA-like C-terminal region-containing protein [Bacteroidota bacterium]
MKKFFRVFFIALLILFLIILSIPLAFKSELMEIAKREVNKNVKAEVNWTDFHVSLFKGFPDLRVSMENMSVKGQGAFEEDTLISFRNFSADVDLLSAISGKVNINAIILDHPVVRAIALDDTTVNWDITYPSEEIEEEEPDTTEMEFDIKLKEFRINEAEISYFDAATSTFASIENLNFLLSGNMSQDYTDLTVNSTAQSVTVDYDNVNYLNKAFFSLDAVLGADMENMKFEISNNELKINDIVLGLDGFFEMTEKDNLALDVRFFSRETAFKSLLSMVPAVYMEDFEDLNTSGTLKLEGTARGQITESTLPEVDLILLVEDGYFAYPDLPEAVENINIDLKVFYDGAAEDNSRIDLDKFHLEIAGNPVNMNFSVRTPVTDMQINGALDARLDFASLKNAIPLEDMDIDGQMNADIEIMGKMSDIENENYEAFRADGKIEVMNVLVEGEDLPVPVNIDSMRMFFSPQYVNLKTFYARLGKSDIYMDGNLENFIPYVFEDEVIRGNLNLRSKRLNLNEIMASEVSEETEEDTVSMTVVEVPENIDFKLTTSIDQLIYDQLEVDNLEGVLIVRESVLNMDKLKMNTLDGTMMLSGEYNTTDISTPVVEMEMDMNSIDIQSSFYAFNTVKQLAPVAEIARGKVSVNFDFVSFLDSTMNPVMSSIVGNGELETDEVKLENSKTFNQIGSLLNIEGLANRQFKDIDLTFEVREGRVYVDPFETKLGSVDLNVSGSQGLDQSLDYDLEFEIPREQFGSTANEFLDDLASQARQKGFDISPGDLIKVTVKVGGTFSDPDVKLGTKQVISDTKEQVREAVEQRVQEEVDKVKDEVTEKVGEEAEKIMQRAEEEAEKIRQSAEEAGEKLIGEAKLRKKQLVKEAGNNPIKKLAAEKTGDGLISSAEKQAARLEAEAEEKAQKVLDEARKRVEEKTD